MYKQKKHDYIRSHSFGGHLNKDWVNQDLRRYQLTYGSTIKESFQKIGELSNADSLNNKNWLTLFNCLGLKKITLHSNSGKLLSTPATGAILDLAFSTIGPQTPSKVYSRKSVAGFKLSKRSLLGVKATLRNIVKCEFYYKLYFLTAGEHRMKSPVLKRNLSWGGYSSESSLPVGVTPLAIKNVFRFNELDTLDYESFSSISGLEIHFS